MAEVNFTLSSPHSDNDVATGADRFPPSSKTLNHDRDSVQMMSASKQYNLPPGLGKDRTGMSLTNGSREVGCEFDDLPSLQMQVPFVEKHLFI
jgi:hypothetical protein